MAEVLTAVAAVIAAIGTIVAAVLAYRARERAAEAKAEIVLVGNELHEVGARVDGRLSDLLEVTRQAAHAAGRTEGLAETAEHG